MKNLLKIGTLAFVFALIGFGVNTVSAQSWERDKRARREYRKDMREAERDYQRRVNNGDYRKAEREYREDKRDARRDYRQNRRGYNNRYYNNRGYYNRGYIRIW